MIQANGLSQGGQRPSQKPVIFLRDDDRILAVVTIIVFSIKKLKIQGQMVCHGYKTINSNWSS